ncbi:uncharacterized protein LDX57_008213 [Aspergillus melleus]|uniref:uncharacterized protein n=1 Tax=Aspergillus melleus TaxID=138277 RepID=UPI001E8DB9C7|nr:uncharacterized protein LDX57_008213 [Aspergillus melleus]KAH8430549.1 hypothetical protein LDX57_008213 [Aspergillus melleus]
MSFRSRATSRRNILSCIVSKSLQLYARSKPGHAHYRLQDSEGPSIFIETHARYPRYPGASLILIGSAILQTSTNVLGLQEDNPDIAVDRT